MNFIINQKNARETTKTATLSNYKKISSCGRYKPFDTELRRNFTAMFHVHLCLFKHIHSFVLRRERDSWFFHPRNCGKLLLHLPINFYKWKLQLRWSRKNLRFKYQINSEILIFVINFLMNSVLIKVKYNYWSYFTTFPLVASFLFPARSRLLPLVVSDTEIINYFNSRFFFHSAEWFSRCRAKPVSACDYISIFRTLRIILNYHNYQLGSSW